MSHNKVQHASFNQTPAYFQDARERWLLAGLNGLVDQRKSRVKLVVGDGVFGGKCADAAIEGNTAEFDDTVEACRLAKAGEGIIHCAGNCRVGVADRSIEVPNHCLHRIIPRSKYSRQAVIFPSSSSKMPAIGSATRRSAN